MLKIPESCTYKSSDDEHLVVRYVSKTV